jgi:CRISPR-associated protein Cmr3
MAPWFFPRPLDLLEATLRPALLPAEKMSRTHSSLPEPLKYPIANTLPPTKDSRAKAWLSAAAYAAYLTNNPSYPPDPPDPPHSLDDSAFCDPEATIGIAIDPATGTTGHGETQGKIYSARYLRLRDGWRLGVFARPPKKTARPTNAATSFADLLTEQQQILVGGQQRLCTATRDSTGLAAPATRQNQRLHRAQRQMACEMDSPFPRDLAGNPSKRAKRCPMTPPRRLAAQLGARVRRPGHAPLGPAPAPFLQRQTHPRLRRGRQRNRRQTRRRHRAQTDPRHRLGALRTNDIRIRPEGGAKSTHLAVPAGAVYYFEADSAEAAAQLAAALNWHGPLVNPSDPADPANYTTIRNRRSTLLGEKGFGLGVCGTWQFYRPIRPIGPIRPIRPVNHKPHTPCKRNSSTCSPAPRCTLALAPASAPLTNPSSANATPASRSSQPPASKARSPTSGTHPSAQRQRQPPPDDQEGRRQNGLGSGSEAAWLFGSDDANRRFCRLPPLHRSPPARLPGPLRQRQLRLDHLSANPPPRPTRRRPC